MHCTYYTNMQVSVHLNSSGSFLTFFLVRLHLLQNYKYKLSGFALYFFHHGFCLPCIFMFDPFFLHLFKMNQNGLEDSMRWSEGKLIHYWSV